jgi:ATP-dependent Clp protease adaptor protein ClpS
MLNTEKNSINYNMEDTKTHKIVLHNDDHHDFLYVIACLIRFCNHDAHQAEQCALIADGKGSVDIVSGNYMDMLEINTSLEQMELKSEIKEYA